MSGRGKGGKGLEREPTLYNTCLNTLKTDEEKKEFKKIYDKLFNNPFTVDSVVEFYYNLYMRYKIKNCYEWIAAFYETNEEDWYELKDIKSAINALTVDNMKSQKNKRMFIYCCWFYHEFDIIYDRAEQALNFKKEQLITRWMLKACIKFIKKYRQLIRYTSSNNNKRIKLIT